MISALEFIKDDPKKAGAFIKDAGTIYQKRDEYLVMAGAIAFYHAQQHGDPVFIQKFYDILSKGHAKMFQAFLVKFATYELDGKRDCWLGIANNKFFVKKGSDNIRVGSYEPEDLLASTWFKREKKESDDAPPTDEEKFNSLLEFSKKETDKITKKWEEAGVPVPLALLSIISQFNADVKKFAR